MREDKYSNVRGTFQVREGHTVWVKYYQSPGDGIVRDDYWGTTFTGDREALTAQSQTAENWAAQWSGVLRNNWSMEAAAANYKSLIDVGTFEEGILSGAPIESLDGRQGLQRRHVRRLRRAAAPAVQRRQQLVPDGSAARSHNVKVGYDFQNLESGAQFDYPNRQYYVAESYNPVTRTPVFGPNSVRAGLRLGSVDLDRQDQRALRARQDGAERSAVGRSRACAGRRQTGSSDIGQATVDTSMIAPRLSGTYDLTGDGNSLITGSYGRYYASIIQSFSDAFAQVAQQTNYDNYVWNGTRVRVPEPRPVERRRLRLRAEPRSEGVAHGRIHGRLSASARPHVRRQRALHLAQLGQPDRRRPHVQSRRHASSAKC